jgi:acyl carrier protein
MYEFVEPQVRHLVAEHLGVESDALVSAVSLREDLAADSLDLAELALALEHAFAIEVPERILDAVRTYADLVHATGLLIRGRWQASGAEPLQRIRACIISPAGESNGTLERTAWLTPYAVETIAEDAVRAGRGALLEVTVAGGTAKSLAQVERRFARLAERGIGVIVRRDDGHSAPPAGAIPACPAERPQLARAGASKRG